MCWDGWRPQPRQAAPAPVVTAPKGPDMWMPVVLTAVMSTFTLSMVAFIGLYRWLPLA